MTSTNIQSHKICTSVNNYILEINFKVKMLKYNFVTIVFLFLCPNHPCFKKKQITDVLLVYFKDKF